MKMLMIICPDSRQEALRELLGKHAVHAYSEIPGILGEGKTGKHLDNRTWPGKSALIFTAVPDEKESELVATLRQMKLYPGEGLTAFALPVEQVL